MEGSALWEWLPITNTPAVEVLAKEMSVPVDISRDGVNCYQQISLEKEGGCHLLSIGLHPPAILSKTILLLSQMLVRLLML